MTMTRMPTNTAATTVPAWEPPSPGASRGARRSASYPAVELRREEAMHPANRARTSVGPASMSWGLDRRGRLRADGLRHLDAESRPSTRR